VYSIYQFCIITRIAILLRRKEKKLKRNSVTFMKSNRKIFILLSLLFIFVVAGTFFGLISSSFKNGGSLEHDIYHGFIFLSMGISLVYIPIISITFQEILRLKFTERQLNPTSAAKKEIETNSAERYQ
jgi:protein-S-isoprenylcysteine O-methyltransferase Ste14